MVSKFMNNMPDSWCLLKFPDCYYSVSTGNKNISTKEYLAHGDYAVIDQGKNFIGGYCNDVNKLVKIKKPVIIFGDHTKIVKYINFDFVVGADGVKILCPYNVVLEKYLFYLIQSYNFSNLGYARHFNLLNKQIVPLAPLNEQHRIVAKIEELFSKLDKGIESLKAAQAQLKKYRQALLKDAFEGKLTTHWRAQQGDSLETPEQLLAKIQQERESRYQQQLSDWQQAVTEWEKAGKEGKKPSKPKEKRNLEVSEELITLLPKLPSNYKYIFLDQLGDLARGKSKHRPRNDPKLFGGNYPFIQTGDVKAANRIITTYTQTLNEVGLAQSKLWPKRTLCITIAANIAETAFLGFDGCFPDSIVGYTAYDNIVLPKYIELFIKATKEKLSAYAPATAQKNINLTTLENLVIPYTALNEQLEIINQLDKQFSVIDNDLDTINSSLIKSQSLRQAILKKAFAGELVPQDPADEPANELLARIAEEKAALAKQTKALKTKKGTPKP